MIMSSKMSIEDKTIGDQLGIELPEYLDIRIFYLGVIKL
jgi:hypothetical protein